MNAARRRGGGARSRRPRPSVPPSVTKRAPPAAAPADRTGETLLLAATALCLLLRAAAGLSASGWLSGNTFRDWPTPWPVALPALAALAFVPGVARAGGRALERAGDALSRSRVLVPGLLAAVVAAALLRLRDPLLFTGDADARVGLIARGVDMRALLPQLSPLDALVNVDGARWLMRRGLEARTAIQVIGAGTGALFVLAALGFLRAAGARGAAWIAGAALLLGGGWLVHFAGYEKHGLLLVGLTLAATGAVRLAREGRGAWWLAAGLAIALPAHRAAYAVLPAALWSLAGAWRTAPRERRAPLAFAGAAFLAVALALLPRTARLLMHYDLAVNVVGSATVGRVEPLRQLANILNVLFLLSPYWPVGAVAAWWIARRRADPAPPTAPADPGAAPARGASLGAVAALALAGELAVMLVTRGRQGPLRDWDNQVGPALVVTLASAGALIAFWRRSGAGRTALPVCAGALVAGLALWGIHADAAIGGRRIATLLSDRAAWNREERARAYEFVGSLAFNAGRYDEAARAYEAVVDAAPSPRMMDNYAMSLGMSGRTAESHRALIRAMAMPQSSAIMWTALARLAWALGDSGRSAICADSAVARGMKRGRVGAGADGEGPGAGPPP